MYYYVRNVFDWHLSKYLRGQCMACLSEIYDVVNNVEMQNLPICTVHSSSVHNESFEIDHTELS